MGKGFDKKRYKGIPMTKIKDVRRQFYSNYVKKAEEFYDTMETAFQKQHWDACVSSAVHTVISILDAIAVQQLGKRSSSQNHLQAVLLLNDIKTHDENRKSNLKNGVMELINLKTPSEYGEKLMSRAEAKKAMDICEKVYTFIVGEIKKGEI